MTIRLSSGRLFAVSMLVQSAARFFLLFYVARILGPEEFAPWTLIQAFLSYSVVIGLGVMPALARELTMLKGAKRERRYQRLARSSLSYLLLWWLAGGILSACFFYLWPGTVLLGFGILGASLQSIQQYQIMIVRAELDFRRLAQSQFTGAAELICGAFVIVYWPTFEGLFLIMMGALLVQTAVLLKGRIVRPANPFRAPQAFRLSLGHLQKVGLPLMLAGFISALLITVSRWVVYGVEGQAALGLFALAVLSGQVVQLFHNVLGQIYFPTITYQWGRKSSWDSVMPSIVRFLGMNVIISVLICLAGLVLLPVLTPLFLPQYADGIDAAIWILVAMAFLAPTRVFRVLLQVTDRLWILVLSDLLALFGILTIVGATAFLTDDLELIAAATAAGYAGYLIALAAVTARVLYSLEGRWPSFSSAGPS